MSVSITPCPACQSLVLSDTVQCPTCGHILDAARAADLPDVRLHDEKESEASAIPCPDCGEMVRKELVRCWKCGGFLRAQLADSFQKKLDSHQFDPTVHYQELPEVAADDASAEAEALPAVEADDEDDDFELSPEIAAAAANVPPATEVAAPPSESPDSTDEAYSLASPAEASDAATEPTEAATQEEPSEEPASEETKSDTKTPSAEADVAHSVATGGDALLNIALEEEKESTSRQKGRGRRARKGGGPRTGFIIFCPNGHQVEVQDRHRGMMGRCPKCKSFFLVPQADWDKPKEAEAKAKEDATAMDAAAKAEEKYQKWLTDVKLHTVDPVKLKLKPGSLQENYELVDLGFARDGILAANLVKGAHLKGATSKKHLAARETMLAHLAEDKPLDELPGGWHHWFNAEGMQIQVVQPAVYAHESMFAGIPVFGVGRIAVRLPSVAEGSSLLFLSFFLSQFREFASNVSELFGLQELGVMNGVPLQDSFTEMTCHYSDAKLQILENVDFYQGDPGIPLKLVAWRCGVCKLVVSEDSRKKERIGGPNGKGIAKAKCPKCKGKFGDNRLYTIEGADTAIEEQAIDSTEV